LKGEIKKKQLKKNTKNHSSQPKSTDQTCDLSYETRITSQNANQNKLGSLISNQPNIKGWNLKKKSTKKITKKTWVNHPNLGHGS
jgi:galactokinase/mevalonate kinase-like predicted kinase